MKKTLRRWSRSALVLVPLFGVGLPAYQCGSATKSTPTSQNKNSDPLGPIAPLSEYRTDLDKSYGVGAGMLAQLQQDGSGSFWREKDEFGTLAATTNAYSGQAGALLFLARLQRERPDPELRRALQDTARWLQMQRNASSPALFEGAAGIGWALLEASEVLNDTTLRSDALAIGDRVAADASLAADRPGDLFGHAGIILYLLKLHRVTGDAKWLEAARRSADLTVLNSARVVSGLKFQWRMGTVSYYYVGFSHGAAGTGFALCRLADALGSVDGAPYLAAAIEAAGYVQSMAHETPLGLNYSRREPDQLEATQATWCHGAPGIGLLWVELYRCTGNVEYLALARRCAETTYRNGRFGMSLCHGAAGNAWLALALYRVTGEQAYLDQARETATYLWDQARLKSARYPSWLADDGSKSQNVGLYTGRAGAGVFFLALHRGGQDPMPFLD